MTTHFQQHVDRLRDVLADFNRDWENDTANAERELRLKIHALEQEKAERDKREPLVLEVIRLYTLDQATDDVDEDQHRSALMDACRKLAEYQS